MPSPFEKRRCCCSMIVFMHSSGKSYRSRFYRLTLLPTDLCEGGLCHIKNTSTIGSNKCLRIISFLTGVKSSWLARREVTLLELHRL